MIGEESLFANYILISAQTNRVSPAVVVKDTAAALNCFIFVSLTLRSLIFVHKNFEFWPQEQNSLIFRDKSLLLQNMSKALNMFSLNIPKAKKTLMQIFNVKWTKSLTYLKLKCTEATKGFLLRYNFRYLSFTNLRY